LAEVTTLAVCSSFSSVELITASLREVNMWACFNPALVVGKTASGESLTILDSVRTKILDPLGEHLGSTR
jgi:hypothetical protein